MNEPNWYEIGIAALLAIFGWALRRFVKRMDSMVTREELDKAITQIREERREQRDDRVRMHAENTAALQHISERVDRLVDRG